MPTDIPTEEPSPTPEPTEEPTEVSQFIEPNDSSDGGDGTNGAEPTEPSDGTGTQATLPAEDGTGDENSDGQTIGPTGPDDEGNDNSGQGGDGSDNSGQGNGQEDTGEGDNTQGEDGQTIEPSGETTPVDIQDDGNNEGSGSDQGDDGSEMDTGGSQSLASAEVYTDVASVTNAGDRFGVSAEGELIFSSNPGRASLENNGFTAAGVDTGNGQIVQVCNADGSCVDASGETATGSQTDTPLGWLDGELIYERMNGEAHAVEFRAIRFVAGSLDVAEDRSLGGSGSEWESIVRPYPVNGYLLVPSVGTWLRVTTSSVQVLDQNPYGNDMSLYRVHPEGNVIAYVADGSIQVASLDRPGSPYATVPFTGADYDISPDGQQIAIISGDGIEILDLDGNPVGRFPNDEGISVNGIAWTTEGILFVDSSSGAIRIFRS